MGLDTVELVLDTEKHFSISFQDEELVDIETVEFFCKLIRQKMVLKDGFKAPSYLEIYHYIINCLVTDFGVDAQEIHPHSRFVKDLGLDS